ncbi:MAG: beta-ketoacyl-ACP synthase III [Lentisphaeria bacterium]|nr:beta-ketoacyl-ACP synthase III [Lentisphaeria bacterium]
MTLHGIRFAGFGSYAPEKVLTNADLEKIVDTSDEWIVTRTGIRERHIAAENEATSDLAYQASVRALEDAGFAAEDLDAIFVATFTPDYRMPNTACFLQEKLGAPHAACFSLEAACTGFLYSLEAAAGMMRSASYRKVLVVGAEKLTTVMDFSDRNTCVLFGDGAGAVVLEQVPAQDECLLSSTVGADGSSAHLLQVPAGGSVTPTTKEALDKGLQFIRMEGREVFKKAVNAMTGAANKVLDEAGVTADDVTWLVPHQANTRIIQGVGKKLNIPEERVFINLDKYGNTSAASIPLALDEMYRDGKMGKGDLILLVAFGGGLTYGATLFRV